MKGKIFNTEQVRAIQEGRMTQFMQEVKPQPSLLAKIFSYDPDQWPRRPWTAKFEFKKVGSTPYYEITDSYKCPLGKVGDVIYVREGWFNDADSEEAPIYVHKENFPNFPLGGCKWRSPATMPREAARLFLRIENIRVMTVQDLTEEDALKQGYEVIHEELCPALCALKSEVFEKGLEYIDNFHWIIDFSKTDKP